MWGDLVPERSDTAESTASSRDRTLFDFAAILEAVLHLDSGRERERREHEGRFIAARRRWVCLYII